MARSAERNPSIFAENGPRSNVSEVLPLILQLAYHLDHGWANTKFLISQYSPAGSGLTKAERKRVQEAISSSKSIEQVAEKLSIDLEKGKGFMEDLCIQLLKTDRKVDSALSDIPGPALPLATELVDGEVDGEEAILNR